jgi:hypothetical protein
MIIYNINYNGFKLILEKVHKKIDFETKSSRNVKT